MFGFLGNYRSTKAEQSVSRVVLRERLESSSVDSNSFFFEKKRAMVQEHSRKLIKTKEILSYYSFW